MIAYLDASVVVPRFVGQAESACVKTFIAGYEGDFCMTEFGAAEVSSAVARLWRIGRLTDGAAADALSDFDRYRFSAIQSVDLTAADLRAAHPHVRRFELKLRTPDALHLAVTQRIGATLVTLDRRLADAAGALGIAVAVPG